MFFFLLFFTLLMMAQQLGTGVSASIFLTRAGIDKLPSMLLVAAMVSFLSVLAYMYLSARKDNRALFSLIMWATVAVVVPSRLLSSTAPVVVAYLLYGVAEFMVGIFELHFSVYLADYFDTLQAKRLFPLIFAGSRIGGITGGLVLTFAAGHLGTINILWIWAGSIVVAVFLLNFIDRIFPPQVFDFEKQSREASQFFQHIKGGLQFMKNSLLLKSLAAGIFLLGFLSLIIKFLYSEIFVATFPQEDQLTAFFGIYIIATNLLGFVIQVTMTNRIIDSLGIGAANNLYAVGFVSGFAGLVFAYGFPAALWARFTDEQLESAIQDPVESLLFNGVPDNERARARALSSGLIKPISEISGGLALQLMKGFFIPGQIALFGFLASIAYVVVAILQNQGYVEGLMHMVKDRTLNLEDLTNLRWEKASRKDLEALYRLAEGEDSRVRDSATTLLLHLDEDIDFSRLMKSFLKWSPEVEEDFLRNYFRRVRDVDESFLGESLGECPAGIKCIIIEYFIETASTTASDRLLEYLKEGADLSVQNSAIRYFMLVDSQGRDDASQLVKLRMESTHEKVIHANLSLIRDLYDEAYIDYVRGHMENPDRAVAIDAVKTLGEIFQPLGKEPPLVQELVRDLMGRSGYHEQRAAAMILSKRNGPWERDSLLDMLNATSGPLRSFIIDILVNNYSGDMDIFFERLESPAVPLTGKENIVLVLQKLNRITDQDRLKEILRNLISSYFQLILEQDWLKQNRQENSLMLEMNERKKSQIRITVLEMLEIFLHQKVVISIEKALLTRNPRLISNAMELFGNIWDKKQAKSLITLLYPRDFEEELKLAKKFFEEVDGTVNCQVILDRYLQPDLHRWDICSSLLLLKDMPRFCDFVDLEPFVNHKDPLVAEIARTVTPDGHGKEGGGMLTTIEKIICLKNAPLFKSLKMDELKMVAEIVREKNCSPKEVIIEKGEVGSRMFIIASGEVEVYLPGNPRKTLVCLREPEFFGEMAIFGDDVRSASIMALKPTLLLCLERDHFFNLIYEKPEISIEIIKVLSDRLRWMDQIARTPAK